jgi:hypothetical protein
MAVSAAHGRRRACRRDSCRIAHPRQRPIRVRVQGPGHGAGTAGEAVQMARDRRPRIAYCLDASADRVRRGRCSHRGAGRTSPGRSCRSSCITLQTLVPSARMYGLTSARRSRTSLTPGSSVICPASSWSTCSWMGPTFGCTRRSGRAGAGAWGITPRAVRCWSGWHRAATRATTPGPASWASWWTAGCARRCW